ncbi:hypothetical protein [Ekhidna sp.]|uniref:hypothetical protein n=1 Tax=Ekhidna sp. TaxID=2608089 RepID=UPI003BABA8EF
MNRSFLQLEYSGWWILLIVIAAVLLSYMLYSKKNTPWNKTQNWILATIRFLAILSVSILLLSPAIRQITNTVEKPIVAIALDNSESIVARGTSEDSIKYSINQIKESLEELELDVPIITFNDSINFSSPTSNLSKLVKKVEDQLEGQHLSTILLATDGIYNRGSSPLYKNYLKPVVSLGLGDTLSPRDISISRTLYNRITYKGNETPIRLEVKQKGYDNREVLMQLRENGKVLDKQKIQLKNSLQEVEFTVKSENEGLRRLVASITQITDESTFENNKANVFMEVIDGRKKVLIVANAPHPDIKAIRSTLEETGNYQTEVYIPEINDQKPNEVYDVVIFHGAFTSGINFIPKENPGIWYIISNESSITSINKNLPFLNIERRGSQPDKVAGSFNQNFSKFKIEDVSAFEEYPPVQVPFGDYSISGPTEILMYQKLGNIITQKPLMTVYDDGASKTAVLLGQNIWQWKLQESAINKNSNQFDNLITKTIQFLSVKNDKKQFRFSVRKRNITDTEPPLFDVEVYNDIYERIYNNKIAITITPEGGESQNFTFTDSEFNSVFRSPSLPPGIYRFSASVNIGDKTYTDRGEFSVQNINPEYLDLTADHQLLRNISKKSGGKYFHLNERGELINYLKTKDLKSKIKSEENLIPLYQAWWWYLIIFLLFSSEWFLRKFWGGY